MKRKIGVFCPVIEIGRYTLDDASTKSPWKLMLSATADATDRIPVSIAIGTGSLVAALLSSPSLGGDVL